MYCGAKIPVELRLSDDQKSEIAEKQQKEHKRQMEKTSRSSPDNDDSIVSVSISIASDISGGGDCS